MRIPQGVYVDTKTGEVLTGKRIANHLDMPWNADDTIKHYRVITNVYDGRDVADRQKFATRDAAAWFIADTLYCLSYDARCGIFPTHALERGVLEMGKFEGHYLAMRDDVLHGDANKSTWTRRGDMFTIVECQS